MKNLLLVGLLLTGCDGGSSGGTGGGDDTNSSTFDCTVCYNDDGYDCPDEESCDACMDDMDCGGCSSSAAACDDF